MDKKRGVKPGSKKNGGRLKGTPNKKTRELIEILELKGYDPVAKLIKISDAAEQEYDKIKNKIDDDDEDGIDQALLTTNAYTCIKTMQSTASDLMQYVYPKRKAIDIDHKNPFLTGEKITVDLRWADEEDDDEDNASDEKADSSTETNQ